MPCVVNQQRSVLRAALDDNTMTQVSDPRTYYYTYPGVLSLVDIRCLKD
jgi:hypothetical protein